MPDHDAREKATHAWLREMPAEWPDIDTLHLSCGDVRALVREYDALAAEVERMKVEGAGPHFWCLPDHAVDFFIANVLDGRREGMLGTGCEFLIREVRATLEFALEQCPDAEFLADHRGHRLWLQCGEDGESVGLSGTDI